MSLFGGFVPGVFNLYVRLWMLFQKRNDLLREEHHFPTCCGTVFDFANLGLMAISFLFMIVGVTSAPVVGSTVAHEERLQNNIVAISLTLLSGVLLGTGLAQVKILCSFKELRELLNK